MAVRPFAVAGFVALLATTAVGQMRQLPVVVERIGTIYVLDMSRGGRVFLADGNGNGVTTVAESGNPGPDGIVVDQNFTSDGPLRGRVYWTTMGRVEMDDGTIEAVDFDGRSPATLVPKGFTFTPKQIKLDNRNRIYWADREGMRIMRANRDGSRIETLVETGHGEADRRDARNWCVGIAIDSLGGRMYWTQKGAGGTGRIRRAGLDLPPGQTAADRTDIETLFDGLPEPIDLDLDRSERLMYWTDRGDAPRGNTVSRAPMDSPPKVDPARRADQQILFGDLKEGIGIALDLHNGRMFVTDLGGNVYRAKLDGSGRETILTGQGMLTGIAYLGVPRSFVCQTGCGPRRSEP